MIDYRDGCIDVLADENAHLLARNADLEAANDALIELLLHERANADAVRFVLAHAVDHIHELMIERDLYQAQYRLDRSP